MRKPQHKYFTAPYFDFFEQRCKKYNMQNIYVIKYVAFGEGNNNIIKHGSMRCKNKLSEFDAQAALERHFEKKLPGFKKLTVLEITKESAADWLDTVFGNLFTK